MLFDIPRGQVIPIDEVDVRLDPGPHPFEREHAQEIEENWKVEIAANPALYNGRMLLHSELAVRGRRVVGKCNMVNYATLLYWRRYRDTPIAEHAYADAALVSSDNALVVIRMGPHTASPGRVIFAAGSFEQEDVVDGRVDIDANMAREVGEETGIDISAMRRDAGYVLFSVDGGTAIIRRYWLEDTAEESARKIEAFVASQAEPEIVGPVIIRKGEALPEDSAPHLIAFAEWHFAD